MSLFAYSFIASNPQPEKHAPGHQTELQAQLGTVNPEVAEKVHLVMAQLDDHHANEVAEALTKIGSIGKVIANLEERTFTIEYDGSMLNKDKLVKALNTEGIEIKAAHNR